VCVCVCVCVCQLLFQRPRRRLRLYLDVVSTHRAGKCGRLVEEMRAFKGTVVKIWEENGSRLDAGIDPKLLTTVG
jgi:hypothetical protein